MIKEDCVSFEIAKLFKEKGFDGECRMIYRKHDMQKIYHTPNPNDLLGFTTNREKLEKHSKKQHCDYILCPTHQMALKWLREMHGIYITAEPDINDKHYFYPVVYTMTEETWEQQYFNELEEEYCKSPEEAVEAALNYALENLI